MSTTYISAVMRREVLERAGNCCEYCRLSQAGYHHMIAWMPVLPLYPPALSPTGGERELFSGDDGFLKSPCGRGDLGVRGA